ncbi:MAG TPA: trypsin-like peptidase domain-containing protein [Polyangiaceae bacterium]|nr:trypsin-like peptidase domain-containing protein [Polyangiaceae bacterium]
MTRSLTLRTGFAALGFLLAAVDCSSRASSSSPSAGPSTPPVTAPAPLPEPVVPLTPGARTEDERNTISVFRSTAQSAVFVTQRQMVVDYYRGEAEEVPSGSGTGFVWDTDGHVVTNFHVVKDARSLVVTLGDHRNFEAKLVGVEPRKDIAVLQIDAPKESLHPIRLPDKAMHLEVGQKVIAIGNPFGLDHTLTTGVVSAIGREVQGIGGVSIRDMVQTDAAINPGNSGGPLLDSGGALIGMNTMIFSKSGSSAGIGFAVPVSSIMRVVPQIIRSGHAEQIGLGVQIDPAQRLEQRAGLRGVIVLRTIPGSPAEKAGLRGITQDFSGITLGDVIVAIDGEKIADYDDLYNTLDKHHAGDTVEVSVMRERKLAKVKVPVVALP